MKTKFLKLLPIIGIMVITISSCAKKECCTGYERIDAVTWTEGYQFCQDEENYDQLRNQYECDTDMNGVNFKCECD